jgi:adenylate kinase family enzyme
MIIWINGAFGAGKTTIAELLLSNIPDAHIFDREAIGYIIQKSFPAARCMDFQDLAIWRKLVIQFINESKIQFPTPLIIPMTLVVPDYLEEIFGGVSIANHLLHFFLHAEKDVLAKRINNQIVIQSNPEQDEKTRQWRLAQIDRCYSASNHMPKDTIFLDTDSNPPEELVRQIMGWFKLD